MDDLPPLYARWMREHAGVELPRESVATCSTCVMMPNVASPAAPGATYFHAVTKCCTFLPELHNFLVGQLLDDDDTDPAGRASLEARIRAGVEVTPLGLGRSRKFLLLYDEGGDVAFGRAGSLRCPHHLDDGRCGVWRHRESTCATWFCKHVRGETGARVWKSVQHVLRIAERDLAWWSLQEVTRGEVNLEIMVKRSLTPKRTQRVTAGDLDGVIDTTGDDYRALWGPWVGRERELYRACGAKVAGLAWRDVLAIGSPELHAAAAVVTARATAAHSTELPDHLRVDSLTVTALRDEQATIATYSAYDPLTIPMALLEVLDAFDGRSTTDVLASIETDRGIELDPELVRKLVDFGVLVPA